MKSKKEEYNILVLGSGGREHAIIWSLSKDKRIKNLYCAPGNAGTMSIAKNVAINILDNTELLEFVEKNSINLIIVGPEQPLENGVVDFFENKNIKIFGPTQYAAQLETSKLYARKIMEKHNIPQPAFFECKNEEEILSVAEQISFPLVLKADGLAAGKGVIICNNSQEMEEAIDSMIGKKKFGMAANKISVEECLYGEELSVFAICDGENYKILNSAQDHKRIFDNDLGPNTGGMGAYSPTPLFNNELKMKVEDKILKKILFAMCEEGHPFKGFLYIGLMIVDNEPYVIEYNVRLGDPEAQVLIPLIESSLLDIVLGVVESKLTDIQIKSKDKFAVSVVLAAKGYPEKYNKGMLINGLDLLYDEIVFHAGTKYDKEKFYSNGGRVLNVIGIDESLDVAIEKAYKLIDKINYEDKYYRSDIGSKALEYIKSHKEIN